MKRLIAILYTMCFAMIASAQTANLDAGCAPLEVDFTAAAQSEYFWDFGDGGFSDLAAPSHIFDMPGVYTVELFTSENGTKVGDVVITVFDKPDFAISANERSGCSPFQVAFTNESIVDPNLSVTGYLWTFGDGGSSTDENPTHTYTTEGTFTVSLQIQSDLEGCTSTESFDDYITVSGGVDAGFSLSAGVVCETPATIVVSNNTQDNPGYTYAWDFGNGQTSTEYNPDSLTYTNEGDFTIELVVDNGEGCTVRLTRIVRIGKPKINITVPDTMCLGVPATFLNSSSGNEYKWSFGTGASPPTSELTNPVVRYTTPDAKIVSLSAIASDECRSDTFFTIFVEDPSAAFAIDPFVQCLEPATYQFAADNQSYAEYEYYVRELDARINGPATQSFTYEVPQRDSFYINRQDTFNVILEIETHAGCKAIDSTFFLHRAPQAHFIPDVSRGCAPLTVNFEEDSKSIEDITSWTWIFGDGDVVTTTTSEDMEHVYTQPGEYYVKIAIENDAGCRDTSAGIYIYVGEPLEIPYAVDRTEICLYEEINMEVTGLDPRVDAYHFSTDENRISDCYTNATASHQFVHTPGTFPLVLDIDYNGCRSTSDNGTVITVNGSKARIRYMTNCTEPLTVMLQDSSVNASTSIFYMNGDTINMDTIPTDVFNYTFDSTGNYTVTLITTDDTSCPADTATVNLQIRDAQADFELPERLCEGQRYTLNASNSIDVDTTCSKGFTWYNIATRPRTISSTTAFAAWNRGDIEVSMVAEDVNGCTDTLVKSATVYGIDADYEIDRETICYPSEVSFTDLSMADTTVVGWSWSFGSTDQNPTQQFVNENADDLVAQLAIVDAVGCRDTIVKIFEAYEPVTTIDFDPSRTVCLGETINFSATDFTDQGSFLNYLWVFEGQGSSAEQNPSFVVTEPGITDVTLAVTEESTGCNNEYQLSIQGIEIPVAEIGLDQLEYCVEAATVLFENNSIVDGPGSYLWDFENGTAPPGNFGFEASQASDYSDAPGEYLITLTALSSYGCSDADSVIISVTEPQGRFVTSDDDNKICTNDNVTFTMLDTVDVASYTWDFGDGTTVTGQNPVTHTFGFYPPNGLYDVVLELVSENDCMTSVAIPVEAFNVVADIFPDDDFCVGEVEFENPSDSSDLKLVYDWNLGNGETSNSSSPVTTYDPAGDYIITLNVSNEESGCADSQTDTLTVLPNPGLVIPDSIICVGDSLYIQIENFNSAYDYDISPNTSGNMIDNQDILVDPMESLEYIVSAIDNNGCVSEIDVTVDFLVRVQIPNLFSPGNDDINNYFDLILVEKLRSFATPTTFKVYNRWGNIMYDNETPDVGWDGRLSNGDFAPAEVYTYLIEVEYPNSQTEVFKGTVTLIR